MNMRYLKNFWLQGLVLAIIGTSLGLMHKRSTETAWHVSHFRLDEQATFPAAKGIPFASQWLLDAEGVRIDVPIPAGVPVDFRGAAWWSVEDSGRMHLWTEDRVEVCPDLGSERGAI